MGIKRLNHAVLYVSDVRQSADFYHQVLGFKLKPSDSPDRAVFTRAADSDNDHDLALFSKNSGQQRAGVFRANNEPPAEHEPPAGLYHLARKWIARRSWSVFVTSWPNAAFWGWKRITACTKAFMATIRTGCCSR